MKAIWKGAVLAESDDTVVVEGNHYFPAAALRREHFRESATHSVCPWKGTASYYDVVVGADVNRDAAWTYPEPKPAAATIRGRVAFWRGVQVAALAAFVLLGARPAAALDSLTGTWEGKASCDAIDGGSAGHYSVDVKMYLDDGGNGAIGVGMDLGTNFFGRYEIDMARPDEAVLQASSCDYDTDMVEGSVLRAHIKTKPGSVKASLDGTLIVLDGPGGSTTQCQLKLKRTTVDAPMPICLL